MIQQSHSWAYIRTKLSLKKTHAINSLSNKKKERKKKKKTHALLCSLQHYSQWPRHGNNPNGWMMGLGRGGIYTQWNTTKQ